MPITTRETYDANGNVVSVENVVFSNKGAAKELLLLSDLVAVRCVKAGVAFPSSWQTYVTTLRDIVNGSEDDLPAQPDYPEGT